MAIRQARAGPVLVFCTLLTGVMGETLDIDLVGVVVAAICVAVISSAIIAVMAYCCFRKAEVHRKSVINRKDSGSVSTNAHAHCTNHVIRPNQSACTMGKDPRRHGVPVSSKYILGHHPTKGKVIDLERLQNSHHDQHRKREENFYLLDTPRTLQKNATSQTNGHVVRDLPNSDIKLRGIQTAAQKEHKDDNVPNWMRKNYVETEKTMDIREEEGSRRSSATDCTQEQEPPSPSPARPPAPAPKPKPKPKPAEQTLSPNVDPLKFRNPNVTEEFTIIDFVDPGHRSRPLGQGSRPSGQAIKSPGQGSKPSQRAISYQGRDYHTTTEITRYSAPQGLLADTSHGSAASTYVPPVSTSTPRAPADTVEKKVKVVEHHRMRKPNEGSVRHMPVTSKKKKKRVLDDFRL